MLWRATPSEGYNAPGGLILSDGMQLVNRLLARTGHPPNDFS